MGVGELHAIPGEGIDMRGRDFGLGIETGGITIAHVIDQNDDDVWFGMGAPSESEQGEEKSCGHEESLFQGSGCREGGKG